MRKEDTRLSANKPHIFIHLVKPELLNHDTIAFATPPL